MHWSINETERYTWECHLPFMKIYCSDTGEYVDCKYTVERDGGMGNFYAHWHQGYDVCTLPLLNWGQDGIDDQGVDDINEAYRLCENHLRNLHHNISCELADDTSRQEVFRLEQEVNKLNQLLTEVTKHTGEINNDKKTK